MAIGQVDDPLANQPPDRPHAGTERPLMETTVSNIAVFDFEDQAVRTASLDGAPWFVGKDVCRCLAIADHQQALDRLDDDERCAFAASTAGGPQQMIVISEPGVYRLVFTSRTEKAEAFKRWLAHEVLPALRRTGRYAMDDRTPEPEPLRAKAGPGADRRYTMDDIPDLYKALMVLREYRLTHGKFAARRLSRWLPIPQPTPEDEAAGDAAEIIAGRPVVMDEDRAETEEHLAAFIEERLIKAQGAVTSAADVLQEYVDWCDDAGIRPASQTLLGLTLKRHGWKKLTRAGRKHYIDLMIEGRDGETNAPDPEPAEPAAASPRANGGDDGPGRDEPN